MTRDQQLEFCSVCQNRGFNPQFGIVCSLTDQMATFNEKCLDFKEDERQIIAKENQVDIQKSNVKSAVNKGRIALYGIGVLFAIGGFNEAFIMEGHELIFGIVNWTITAIFVGLAIFSYKKATISYTVGLVLYILIILTLTFLEPATIIKGILWKIFIISYLFLGIQAAREIAQKDEVKVGDSDVLDDF